MEIMYFISERDSCPSVSLITPHHKHAADPVLMIHYNGDGFHSPSFFSYLKHFNTALSSGSVCSCSNSVLNVLLHWNDWDWCVSVWAKLLYYVFCQFYSVTITKCGNIPDNKAHSDHSDILPGSKIFARNEWWKSTMYLKQKFTQHEMSLIIFLALVSFLTPLNNTFVSRQLRGLEDTSSDVLVLFLYSYIC